MSSLAFVVLNAIGITVNLIIFCFNLWIQSRLRGRHRLDEATDDYWFRSVFVSEMSQFIKSISKSHISFWESKDDPFPNAGMSFDEYLQHSLQTDLDDVFDQVVVVYNEFEDLPKSVVEDISLVIDGVDGFITDMCMEHETADLSQNEKKHIRSEIVSRLRLLPLNILAVLMSAHKELVSRNRGHRGRWGRWASAAYRKMCSIMSWRFWRPRYWFTSKR